MSEPTTIEQIAEAVRTLNEANWRECTRWVYDAHFNEVGPNTDDLGMDYFTPQEACYIAEGIARDRAAAEQAASVDRAAAEIAEAGG